MAEQVVAEYKLDVDQAVKGLDKLQAETKQLDKDLDKAGKDGTKALDNVGKEASTLSSGLKKLGGVIAAAFAVDRIVAFGKEAVQLAAKAEGVERAFERIGSPQLLANLRTATRNTVADLTLMTTAIQASNFKIPLDELATYLKFATQRANETGKSVDYMVESILTGVGRGSIEVWDNLGFSLGEVRQHLNGVAVESLSVGERAKLMSKLVNAELAKMGDQADTTADKIGQIGVKFENFKVAVGKDLIGTFQELNEEVEITLQLFDVQGVDAFGLALKVVQHVVEDLTNPFILLNEILQRFGGAWQLFKEIIGLGDTQLEKINKTIAENQKQTMSMSEAIAAAHARMKQLNAETEPYVRSLNKLNEELKEIDKEFKDTEIGSQRWIELIGISEKKTQELTKALLKAQARLVMFQQAQRGFDPFAADNNIDSLFDIDELLSETKEIADSYIEETERATNIADKLWEAHFDKLMQETDDFNKKRKKDIEDEEKFQEMQRDMNQQFFNATLSSWQTLTYAISELSRAQYDEQQRGLENLLDKGIISQEEYERRRASLAREQFKKDKEAKLIQASINTALGVTNAIATAPNIILGLVLAAAAAAAGAAEIAVIASQPVPKFKDGGLVKEHGLLKGRSHAQGGIAVEAEGNEYFMPTQPTLKNYGLLEAMRKGIEEQYIMKHYVPQMMDASIFKGMNDIGNSAHLNGLTSGFKDHNLIAAIDRDRQSTTRVLGLIYQELKTNKKRDRYA